MKEIKLNVPDEKASAFAEEFVNLCKKHGVSVDGINPAKDDRNGRRESPMQRMIT